MYEQRFPMSMGRGNNNLGKIASSTRYHSLNIIRQYYNTNRIKISY